MSLYSLVSDAKALLELEPEELAGVLMEHLNSLPPAEQRQRLNRDIYGHVDTVQKYPPDQQKALSQALMEAWGWLEREGLLVPKPGSHGEWMVISRRGQKLQHAIRWILTGGRTGFRVNCFIQESHRRCGRCFSGATTIRRCFRHSKRSKSKFGRPQTLQTLTSESP